MSIVYIFHLPVYFQSVSLYLSGFSFYFNIYLDCPISLNLSRLYTCSVDLPTCILWLSISIWNIPLSIQILQKLQSTIIVCLLSIQILYYFSVYLSLCDSYRVELSEASLMKSNQDIIKGFFTFWIYFQLMAQNSSFSFLYPSQFYAINIWKTIL